VKRLERTQRIPSDRESLWAFLIDLDNLPRWQSGVESVELTTPGPIAIGSVAHVRRSLMGQALSVDLRVTALETGRLLSLVSEASGFKVEAALTLAPGDGATDLSFGMTVSATNPFMGAVEGMVASAADQDIATSLDRLRTLFTKE
jgi:carbon monoxide dehydrogenase subunit G